MLLCKHDRVIYKYTCIYRHSGTTIHIIRIYTPGSVDPVEPAVSCTRLVNALACSTINLLHRIKWSCHMRRSMVKLARNRLASNYRREYVLPRTGTSTHTHAHAHEHTHKTASVTHQAATVYNLVQHLSFAKYENSRASTDSVEREIRC